MKPLTALLLIYSVASVSWTCPETPDTSAEKQNLLRDGLSRFYNGKNEEATTLFQKLIALDPTEPTGYWRELLSKYFRLRQEQHTDAPTLSDKDYEALTSLAGMAVAKAEQKIHSGEKPNFNLFVKASTLSVLALLQFQHGRSEWEDAHANMRGAIKAAKSSKYPDAGFVEGSINYEIAMKFPHGLRWMAVGLPHDEDKARELILHAALDENSPFVDDIKFFIIRMDTESNGHSGYAKTQIQDFWNGLHAKYPDNKTLVRYAERAHLKTH